MSNHNNLHALDWLAKWACYTPDKLFLRDHASASKWTYGQFNTAAEYLAFHLTNQHDLQKGDRLAIYSQNRMEFFLLYFAALKLGVITVPLNFRLTSAELDMLMADAEPKLIVFETEYVTNLDKLTNLPEGCAKISIDTLTPFLTAFDVPFSESLPDPELSENDLVMILYTSCTTGLPKGAMISHKMLFWNSINTNLRLDLNSADHTQAYSPLFHTGGWNVLFTPFLHTGASHTILEKFDPALILELIEKEKATILFGVPTMLKMMADSPRFAKTDLSGLRYAIVGGAPMPIPLIETWHARGVPIRQGYGLTEVGPNCFSLNQADAIRKQGSIGFPNFYIDAKVMKSPIVECGPEEVGELWLRSPVVTPGYWRKPGETSAAITDGWFHTGDMVRKDADGYFYVVDRKKNMFISGGENVYPAEIEAILIQHPDIDEVAVIGIPDQKWGEVGKVFVVSGIDMDLATLQEFCREKLAKYKIPKAMALLDRLPLNEAGKINRKKLMAFHQSSKQGGVQ